MVRNSIARQYPSLVYISGLWSSTREVNGAVVVGVNLVDHILQLRLGGVLAQRAHDGAKLLGGDLSYWKNCILG